MRFQPLFFGFHAQVSFEAASPESSFGIAAAGIVGVFCERGVFSVAQESPEKGRKLCSRWTESDRGKERCTEVLGKAAGQ